MMASVVLASRSAARGRLLAAAGVSFVTEPADIDERAIEAAAVAEGPGPMDLALRLAEEKAAVVARRRPDALVIGADQTLDLDGECLSKPASLDEARAQLMRLRGRVHRLHAAVCTLGCASGQVFRHVSSARLAVRPFSEAFLEDYLEGCGTRVLESVGGYHLEGHGIQLFEAVEGDFFTILGLPMLPLLRHLRACGVLME